MSSDPEKLKIHTHSLGFFFQIWYAVSVSHADSKKLIFFKIG